MEEDSFEVTLKGVYLSRTLQTGRRVKKLYNLIGTLFYIKRPLRIGVLVMKGIVLFMEIPMIMMKVPKPKEKVHADLGLEEGVEDWL